MTKVPSILPFLGFIKEHSNIITSFYMNHQEIFIIRSMGVINQMTFILPYDILVMMWKGMKESFLST
ncbi:MAG: hypothetical protein AB1397_06485 [bacterium]